MPIGGGRQRKDLYLIIPETELGIERRGGRRGLEIKGFLDVLPSPVHFGHVSVTPQLFCKWSSEALGFENLPAAEIVKTRWLRKFDTAAEDPREIALGAGDLGEDPMAMSERPDVGCNVELTNLTKTMQTLSRHAQINLSAARYVGYPEWLAEG